MAYESPKSYGKEMLGMVVGEEYQGSGKKK